MAYDDKRFYCVNTENIFGGLRQAVRAVSLEDGSRVLVRVPLSRARATWRLVDRAVPSATSSPIPATTRPIPRTSTNCRSTMPVIVRRRETGELVQRFVFPTTIADLTFKADPQAPWWRRRGASGDWARRRRAPSPLSDRGRRGAKRRVIREGPCIVRA